VIDYGKDAARLRATAAQCRELAETATDADAAKSLRFIAAEIEAILAIYENDEARQDDITVEPLSPGEGRSGALSAPRG
jgi:hypothetical protein